MVRASKIPAPDAPGLTDWATFALLSTKAMGGYNKVMLSNIDNAGPPSTPTGTTNGAAPQILAGSAFELNGILFKVSANETITGTPVNHKRNYIYAVPTIGGTSCSFIYSATTPVWNTIKGGWFDGNNRALAKFIYQNGQYNRKRILNSYASMWLVEVYGMILAITQDGQTAYSFDGITWYT